MDNNRLFSKVRIVIVIIIGIVCAAGMGYFILFVPAPSSNASNAVYTEAPRKYITENVQAIVTDVDKNQWFAGCMHRDVKITVYIEKYNITDKIEEHYDGMMVDKAWDVSEDDTVTVRISYYVNPNTGERVTGFDVKHLV